MKQLPTVIRNCGLCPYRRTVTHHSTSGVIGIPYSVTVCSLSSKVQIRQYYTLGEKVPDFPEGCPLKDEEKEPVDQRILELYHYFKDSGSDEPGAARIVGLLEGFFPELRDKDDQNQEAQENKAVR